MLNLLPATGRSIFLFFNDTPTTEIYTLSLHDALPIAAPITPPTRPRAVLSSRNWPAMWRRADRKSTRLNSSHTVISYAVFCLKKKMQMIIRMAPVTRLRPEFSARATHEETCGGPQLGL